MERWNAGILESWGGEPQALAAPQTPAGIGPPSTGRGRFVIFYSLYLNSLVLSILHNLLVAVKQNLRKISGFFARPSTGFRRVVHAGSSTGAPALDRDRVSRPQGTGIDIGAYEWHTDDVLPVEPDPNDL